MNDGHVVRRHNSLMILPSSLTVTRPYKKANPGYGSQPRLQRKNLSCCCSRLSQAVLRGRDAFEASFVGDMSAPGSVRKGFRKGVPCWSQSFPFIFLFNGFRKRRFESFCGGGFAWLGPESCCCSRLSQAVYSKARFRDAFEASFVGDMSAPGSVRQGFPCWGQSFPFIFLSF